MEKKEIKLDHSASGEKKNDQKNESVSKPDSEKDKNKQDKQLKKKQPKKEKKKKVTYPTFRYILIICWVTTLRHDFIVQ